MAGTGGPRLLSSSQGLSPSRHLPQRSGGPLHTWRSVRPVTAFPRAVGIHGERRLLWVVELTARARLVKRGSDASYAIA